MVYYGIFTYICHKNQLNVGNIPYMQPMGFALKTYHDLSDYGFRDTGSGTAFLEASPSSKRIYH